MRPLLVVLSGMLLSAAHLMAVTVTGHDNGTISQMPGSATDFVFFPSNVKVLQDFSYTSVSDDSLSTNPYGGNQYYSTIKTPTGASATAGIYYQHSPYSVPNNGIADLVTFTLGSSPTFDYADFNLYVLYSNADVGETNGTNFQTRDLSISFAPGSNATGAGATKVTVTDTNVSTSAARVVEFNVQGMSAGQTFTLAASPLGQDPAYLGGVSFESAPEPSTWAMFAGGLLLLGGGLRYPRRGLA